MSKRTLLVMGLVGAMGAGCGDTGETPPADTAVTDVADVGKGDAADDAEPDTAEPDAAGDVDVTPAPALQAVEGEPNFAVAAAGWYRGDFHYHTNYSGDAKEQGGDDLAVAIAIADAYRDPVFLAANPDKAGNGLDFVAITDHRTDAAFADPDFTHDHLILVPGEEYGGGGHAIIAGLDHHIPHDAAAGQAQDARHLEAMAEAHAQGAFFSINHPCQENMWNWSVDLVDAIELWNGPWASFYTGASPEHVEAEAAGAGFMNPFLPDAIANGGTGHNDKAMRYWQNMLTAGLHVAPIGGSDRHMIVPAALPTTYVRRPANPAFEGLEGPALGSDGIVAGVREGGTFVSRSPFGAQIELTAVSADGQVFPMGAELPGAGTYTVQMRVGRAEGGRLRLLSGPLKAPVDGHVSADVAVVFDEPIPSDLAKGEFTWEVPAEGAWLHAVVLEDLTPDPLPEAVQEALAHFQVASEGNALVVMAGALAPLLDINILLDPTLCDPAAWDPWMGQCMPVDQGTLATFYLPDRIERLVQIVFEDGAATDWAMGAISSAFLARPQ